MNEQTPRILIVDDQEANRSLLCDFVEMLGHHCFTAATGAAAFEILGEEDVDLVLLDIMMPVMDGYEVLQRMRSNPAWRHVPVIVISGVDEMQSISDCIKKGADDYLTKPFNPTLLQARIAACLDRKRLHDREEHHLHQIKEYNTKLEERVREAVQEISQTQLATIFAMSKLAESRDPETGEHLERMREYARVVAGQLKSDEQFEEIVDENYIENLYAAAPLHDIGKVGIPDNILQKPGRLTTEEYNVMKLHTRIGGDTLRAVEQQHPGNSFIQIGIQVAECHHERWDGSGYPNGLAGEDIPLPGRILALADVYDALTSKRCYKEAFSHAKSREIILEGTGAHFDPAIVKAFLDREEEFISIRCRYIDSEKTIISNSPDHEDQESLQKAEG